MKKDLFKKIFLLGITSVFLVVSIFPVYGSQLTELQKQQSDANKKIKSYRKEINSKNQQIKSLTKQMEFIDTNINAAEIDLKNLEDKLKSLEKKVKITNENLEKTEVELEERSEVFNKRLVEIYKTGDVDFMEVLLSSTNVTDFLVRFELLSKIADQDMNMLDEIEEKKQQIEEYKKELEENKQNIAEIKNNVQWEYNRLEEKKKEKADIQNKLVQDKATIEKFLNEEEAASNQIENKIRDIQAQMNQGNNNFKYSGGVFTWPVPSSQRITSPYGWRTHPVLGTKKIHTGIDIGAGSGSTIKAAADGIVTFAGWYGAYGNAVLIEHGSNITTLYGHMSSISVKDGQKISKGDTIGKVGSTGLSTGPHLHFEVRKSGKHTDPMNYLK